MGGKEIHIDFDTFLTSGTHNFNLQIILNHSKLLIVVIVLLIFTLYYARLCAQPIITSFSPTSGPIGTSVTITGANFNPALASNIVFFGATQAVVTAATTDELEVIVPFGATYIPISILVNGLTGYSTVPFGVTFEGLGIDTSSFEPRWDFEIASRSGGVYVGDLDGDGKSDLAITHSNSISVWRNTSLGPGSISFEPKGSFTAEGGIYNLKIVDLNNDGKLDLVGLIFESPYFGNGSRGWVAIFRNMSLGVGSISFDRQLDLEVNVYPDADYSIYSYAIPIDLAFGDVDNDGKPDLVVAAQEDVKQASSAHGIWLFKNISTSNEINFTIWDPNENRGRIANYNQPMSVSLNDLDSDGKPDLVVGSVKYYTLDDPSAYYYEDSYISIYRNIRSGNNSIIYEPRADYIIGKHATYSMLIGDLNEDNKLDIVADGTFMRNTSSGPDTISFAQKEVIGFELPRYSFIGNIDGDGKPDLAGTNRNSNKLEVFRNVNFGDGDSINFASKVELIKENDNASIIGIGDLDNDGKADLVIGNGVIETVSVFRNKGITVIDTTTIAAIDKTSFSSSVSLAYPNPFNRTIRIPICINSKNALIHINVTDLMGKPVLEEQLSQSSTGDFEYVLNTDKLKSNVQEGIYFIRIEIRTKINVDIFIQRILFIAE